MPKHAASLNATDPVGQRLGRVVQVVEVDIQVLNPEADDAVARLQARREPAVPLVDVLAVRDDGLHRLLAGAVPRVMRRCQSASTELVPQLIPVVGSS